MFTYAGGFLHELGDGSERAGHDDSKTVYGMPGYHIRSERVPRERCRNHGSHCPVQLEIQRCSGILFLCASLNLRTCSSFFPAFCIVMEPSEIPMFVFWSLCPSFRHEFARKCVALPVSTVCNGPPVFHGTRFW